MNLLGKILVMLILVMSIFFMSFAIMVYMSHINWKDKSSQAAKDLAAQRTQNKDLSDTLDKVSVQRAAENAARRSAVATLEGRTRAAEEQLGILRQQEAELKGQISVQTARVDGLTKQLEESKSMVDTLRQSVKSAETERDNMFVQVVDLKGKLIELEAMRKRLEESQQSLMTQNSQAEAVLRANNLTRNTDISKVAPPLDGKVRRVDGDNRYVEISLGEDEGLRRGHTLDVHRQDKYLGRVQVTRVEKDWSAARVLDDFRKGAIREGDGVRTKIW